MPVDRQRMRPWLEEQINSGKIKGLHWVDEKDKIFQIPWMHAARHGWDLDKDAPLFMNWAIHTGKYHPGVDKPDPKTWKANFRCAMNSLPDIEEVKDKSMKRGCNAFRMYRMLSPSEKAAKKGKKKMEREPKTKRRKGKNTEPPVKDSVPAHSKEDTLPDSTVLLTEHDVSKELRSPSPSHRVLGNDPPDVCAVVEITTENEESRVSSTQLPVPLQISPDSSCGEIGNESTCSDEDDRELHPQDLSIHTSRRTCSSVLRIAPSPSDRTFVSSGKTNFWVTSCQEESPLVTYDMPPWQPFLSSFPFDLSASSTARASVITKAMDLSSAMEERQ
ncbi:interferon regulatory factor 2a isoform X2 [Electrophorus electricus]|uniref:IRF tryptophan pentad repeat domain-containing protein n=1 Tax=Electrophorus electricus TaxID=8005 RepID=A0A4W4HAR9_ELEEL|nr:interferon regulatory factor 2a isoform X2 [Electrophorus electricus]